MKFMKLGTKPDNFQTEGNIILVATDLASDVAIEIDDMELHLHKFPLLCKSGKIQKLIAEARDENKDVIELHDFPGGVECLELCMKFCYGIGITLNAFNVMAVRAGAEYLEMAETIEKGNLVFKLEVFLNSSVFRSWKDSILVLQSTKALMPWSEDLKIVSRCIDSISSKTAVDPVKVDWSFTYTRPSTFIDHSSTDLASPPWNGIQSRRHRSVPRDWWVEDICELEIDFYWRVMVTIKAKGMSQELVGEALRVYALRWLPGLSKDETGVRSLTNGSTGGVMETAAKHRLLLETVVNLLPAEKGTSSCSFLLKLLKAATILNASPSSKMELARRIGLQLEEATLNDLLIPSLSYATDSLYDVDLVHHILEHFLMQDQSPSTSPSRGRLPGEVRRRTRSAENLDLTESRRSTAATHSSKLKVAKLIDNYLAEIARDPHIPLAKFTSLAEAVPEFARPVHDGLYRSIDMYLKEHPGLTKSERKRICRLMDCKKLSMDACMHAAQNERLPLRVVVQVLFFEQVRSAMTGGFILNELPMNIRALLPPSQLQEAEGEEAPTSCTPAESWETVHHDFKALKGDLANMKTRIAEAERERGTMQQEVIKHTAKPKTRLPFQSLSKRFGRMFFHQQKEHNEITKSSDTSTKDSESSTGSGVMPGGKATSRRRRHSVS